MGFVAPLALLGLLAVPLIVAFYMLRLRRPRHEVSSTYLWQQLVRDVEANAPWQRLRRSLLLLLQVFLAIVLAVLVARPFTERPAALARDLVLVIDASASMAASDVFPDRLAAAKRRALEAMANIPADGRVSVIVAGETARVVANEATDRGRIARAIESIEQTTARGDMTEALVLAGKLAERARGAEILVVTDDAGSAVPEVALDAPVRVLTVGRERHNQAIAALAVQADPSGLKRSVFISVTNYSTDQVVRTLQVLADGTAFTARELTLRPLSRNDVVIDEVPPGTRIVEARLTIPASAGAMAGADFLTHDDAAWAIVPPDRVRFILYVGTGNLFITNALALVPNVELYGVTPEQWAATTGKELFDLIVFDGFLPPELPSKPILAFAPPATSPLGEVAGPLDEVTLGQLSADEPLLRGVDLTRLHIAPHNDRYRTQRMALPPWARTVIPGGEEPLMYAGLRDGLPTAVFAFDLRNSDLGLQIAWPILLSNLASELLGLGTTLDPIAPADPIDLPLTAGATGIRVTLPDGTVEELAPGATGASTVTFVNTRQLGVYRAEIIMPPSASPSPGTSPSPAPTASPSAAPSATPSAEPSASPAPGPSPTPPPADDGPLLFAVDLFAPDESNIAPGDGARLVALGSDEAPSPDQAGIARDEFWPLLVTLALGFLLVEWLVYERDGARRIANWLRGGWRGGPGSPADRRSGGRRPVLRRPMLRLPSLRRGGAG